MTTPNTNFLVNLRRETASPEFRSGLQPPGYLVAPAYLTQKLRRSARDFSRSGAIVVADNGMFDDITRLAEELKGKPADQRLADAAASLAATVDPEKHFDDQLAVEPTAIIGVEDITAALWLRLGLTSRSLPNQRFAIRTRNRRTARAAIRLSSKVPSRCAYLAVASAQDYDMAFDAGREFAAAGLTGAAMGFGAFMKDETSTRSVKLDDKDRELAMAMPNRYLGTALVARGFWDGWKAKNTRPPQRFHFLGLGAPIMIAIISCAASQTEQLTFDATSPIKDAAEATLYVSKPAYLKIRTWKVAERLASHPGERWGCPCRFCTNFLREHPFDYQSGSAWRSGESGSAVQPSMLRPGGPLFDHYPLLGQPTASPLGRQISFARVGHNHWALKQVTTEVNRARQSNSLEQYVERVVAAYGAATPLRAYKAAVRLAFEIVKGRWP